HRHRVVLPETCSAGRWLMTTTDPLAPAVERLLGALDSGGLDAAVIPMMEIDAAVDSDWSSEVLVPARERMLELDPRSRAELVAILVRGILMIWRPGPETEKAKKDRSVLIRLASMVSRGFPEGPARSLREDWLHLLGRQWYPAEPERAEQLI